MPACANFPLSDIMGGAVWAEYGSAHHNTPTPDGPAHDPTHTYGDPE